jgi:HK97 family phage prohead protease
VPAVSLRASGTSPGTLSGYAAMYGKPSVNLGGFVETLAPGAFRSTLARIKAGEHDLFLLTEHTQQNILARVSAGNLRLEEDAAGLRFTVELPDTQLGRDVRELVGRGVLRGMSFSFSPIRDSWPQPGSRTLHDLTAYEISIVSSPAYPSTSVMATRGRPDAVGWQVARLKALAARPTRAAIARPAARSTAGIEWR